MHNTCQAAACSKTDTIDKWSALQNYFVKKPSGTAIWNGTQRTMKMWSLFRRYHVKSKRFISWPHFLQIRYIFRPWSSPPPFPKGDWGTRFIDGPSRSWQSDRNDLFWTFVPEMICTRLSNQRRENPFRPFGCTSGTVEALRNTGKAAFGTRNAAIRLTH